MKISQIHVINLLIVLFLGMACNGPIIPNIDEDSRLEKTTATCTVSRFLQDKSGNLWFGTTTNGLFKYDGKTFHQYTITDGLDCNKIHCLLEDNEGKIWVGTEEGLCIYNGRTFDKIKIPLPNNIPANNNPYYQNHWVFSMIQAKSGKLWFATIDGVYIYDGKSFTHFPIHEAANGFLTPNNKVERMLEDKDGNIWLGGRTNEGVFSYDGKAITHLKLSELMQGQYGPKPKPISWGWPQLQDKKGNLWFSNWGGAYRYDGKTYKSFTAKDGLPREVTRIVEDREGNLWFGSVDGIRRYDGKTFTHFKDGLINPWVWDILEDKAGNIWVGTRENGVYYFDGTKFKDYRTFKQ